MSLRQFLEAVLPVANGFVVIASSYVLKNFYKIRNGIPPKSHLDVWQSIQDLLLQFPSREVVLVKVESHRDVSEVSCAGVEPLLYLLNELADSIANQWSVG